jgi:hypothetical protein
MIAEAILIVLFLFGIIGLIMKGLEYIKNFRNKEDSPNENKPKLI